MLYLIVSFLFNSKWGKDTRYEGNTYSYCGGNSSKIMQGTQMGDQTRNAFLCQQILLEEAWEISLKL